MLCTRFSLCEPGVMCHSSAHGDARTDSDVIEGQWRDCQYAFQESFGIVVLLDDAEESNISIPRE